MSKVKIRDTKIVELLSCSAPRPACNSLDYKRHNAQFSYMQNKKKIIRFINYMIKRINVL